ncbi:protein UPSTREAM OF FLC [Abrus precatorius]|uniref:Protein UPSTREAM OF FLC n=1 Tax=Abrus precatorius TaxID=3816 RepID=A0A8B8MBI1_ABRPR|nr:protein UPSTREAM OF FLC [Abrus precatorius]
MDVVRSNQRGNNNNRETSPDRAKLCRLKQKVKPSRKVQVVYYLSRNGLLEHPHFMEVTLLPNQPLRLKDVFDRLMALRGSGMPLQYSWSSKRSYKSGYVWYDLGLKDVIHPAEGGEYVLKGSELVEGCSERFQQVNVSNKQAVYQQAETNYNYNSKSKALSGCRQQKEPEEYEEYEEQEKEYEDGEKTSYTSSTTTPHSRCSRGVSTEELVDEEEHDGQTQNNATKVVITRTNNHSPRGNAIAPPSNPTSHNVKRVGDGSESGASRYSVLLQLIACGGEYKMKGKQEARLSNVGTKQREREREREFVCENEMMMNPRLLGTEEKEYFSGSLVDSIKTDRIPHPLLKRSNSYDEQRRSKLGMEVKEEEGEMKGGMKEKCIPLKKSPKESRK